MQSNVQTNIDVQTNVQDHVDASQFENNVEVENNAVHIDASQGKSCVVDTSKIEASQAEGKKRRK